MSTLKSYACYLTNSGDKYNGVPTLVPYSAFYELTILDTPKSPILIFLSSVKNIFKHLISLCIIFFPCKYSIANKI